MSFSLPSLPSTFLSLLLLFKASVLCFIPLDSINLLNVDNLIDLVPSYNRDTECDLQGSDLEYAAAYY